jgi:hypothetical protein
VKEETVKREKRSREYAQQPVNNLRRTQPNLAEFTDDQIDKAHRQWAGSGDFPDESLIYRWVEPVEYEEDE